MSNISSDDILRSTIIKHEGAAVKVNLLSNKKPEDLYLFLATAANKAEIPGNSKSFSVDVNADDMVRNGEMMEFGRRIFQRWSKTFHDFICASSTEDADLKKRIIEALFSKDATGTALIAACLVASFAISPTIAAVISALLMRLIVAPAADEICKIWSESLKV